MVQPLNASSQSAADNRKDLRRRHQIELRVVAQAGGELNASLEMGLVLRKAAKLPVGAFADACLIYRLDDGRPYLAAAHGIPSMMLRGLDSLETLDLEAARPIVDALLHERPLLISDLSLTDDPFARTMRSIKATSVMAVPAPSDQGVMAAVLFIQRKDKYPKYDQEDFEIAQAYGKSTGQALLNAHLYTSQRGIAELFQQAHLPKQLPRSDGYRVDALYESATGGALLGGDWYDAFALNGGKIFLAIGDVLGHGIEAAVLMSKIRQSIRGAALATDDVGTILRIADSAVKLESNDVWATAAIATFSPEYSVLTIARAGHPEPIRYNAHEITALAIDENGTGSPPLGLWDAGESPEVHEVVLQRGDTVVFFTDGLVEFSRDLYEGYAGLYAAIRSGNASKSDTPARYLRDAVVPEMHSDDIAVLTLSIL